MSLDSVAVAGYGNTTNTSKNVTSQDVAAVNLQVTQMPIVQKTTKSKETDNSQERPTEKQIKDAITQINNKIKERRTRCEFTYNEESNRISIKMIDEATDEVIKEIPPEDTIKMANKLWEMAGMLIDERR